MKKKSKNTLPFSKQTVLASRYESYILSIILIIMVCYNKDVSAIAILLSLSWGGYRMLQSFYIWMAKNEHIYELKLRYKKANLDANELNNEVDELLNQDIESEG